MKKLKILMPTDVFPPRCGGSGWSSFFLAKALQERGHRVDVVVPVFGTSKTVVEEYEGLRVTRLGFKEDSALPLLRTYIRTEKFWKQGSKLIEKIIREGKYDLVHAQNVITIPASIIACKRARVPVVSTIRDLWPVCYLGTGVHGPGGEHVCAIEGECVSCWFSEEGLFTKLFSPLIFAYTRHNVALRQALLKQSDAVTCLGLFQKKLFEKLLGRKVHYVPNYIETSKLKNVKKHAFKQPTILFAAKLDYRKGAHLLVQAAALMKNKADFVFLGDGPLKKRLEQRAKQLGVRAFFKGDVPRDQVLSMTKGAAGVAMTMPLPESLGRTVLETGALGVPIVAFATGEQPYVIKHGQNGLLAKPTSRDLALKLDLLLSNARLRARLGRNLKKTIENNYNKARVVEATERVYSSVLG